MRKLQRFWRALEALPGLEAERLEWRRLLGEEWPVVEPLLRQTGALVERVWCPSPSGYDCPRRVVRHDDDRIVAVCGDQPRNCETLSLSLDEIAVLELDVRRPLHHRPCQAVWFERSSQVDQRARPPAARDTSGRRGSRCADPSRLGAHLRSD
jgi:hypothetical protein